MFGKKLNSYMKILLSCNKKIFLWEEKLELFFKKKLKKIISRVYISIS